MKATFEKLYTENKPVISSYISSQGIRKILFAIPMEQPLQLDGTTYTALVVSYDNAVLEKLLGREAAARIVRNGDELFHDQELDAATLHQPKKFLGMWV